MVSRRELSSRSILYQSQVNSFKSPSVIEGALNREESLVVVVVAREERRAVTITNS
jgi:hypothetical protein